MIRRPITGGFSDFETVGRVWIGSRFPAETSTMAYRAAAGAAKKARATIGEFASREGHISSGSIDKNVNREPAKSAWTR